MIKNLFGCASLLMLTTSVGAQEIVKVPTFRNVEDSKTVYGDVLSHSQDRPFGDAHGRSTNAHETAHGIAAWLRNAHRRPYRFNGVYYATGKGLLLREPRFKISNVASAIPAPLRSYRYRLYFVEQLRDWNDTPTYILDEWTAYVWGGECALDDYRTKRLNDGTDAVSGCLDFSIYTVAFCIVLQEQDPKLFAEYRPYIRTLLERAETTFFEGKDTFKSSGQTKLLESLRRDPAAEPIRKFLTQEFDGLFLRRL